MGFMIILNDISTKRNLLLMIPYELDLMLKSKTIMYMVFYENNITLKFIIIFLKNNDK